MRRTFLLAALLLPAAAFAKGKAKPATTHAEAPSGRALGELAGKFKWGMTPDEIIKIISANIHEKYVEPIKKSAMDIYAQDLLRKKEEEEIKAVRESFVKFDGHKTGWDTSIIDHEFAHRNDEAMLILWEKDQRRFLFFWHDKLYKQYIAFNAEHPVFQGKTFDDFAKIIQNRYGQAQMKMATMRTKDDVTLDHLEWPSSGEFTLWAVDQSGFYGNFCLKLMQTSTSAQLDKLHAERSRKPARGSSIIDAVTAPEAVKGDPNADVVDQIVGRKAQRTNQGGGESAAPQPSHSQAQPQPEAKKKPAPAKSGSSSNEDPLAGMKF